MTFHMVTCPLCCQPGFSTSDALCSALVSASTRKLFCPVCNEVLIGLDKLTIHLFAHNLTHKTHVNSTTDQLSVKTVGLGDKESSSTNQVVTNPVWCFQSDSGQLYAVATSSVLNQFGAVTINTQNYFSNTSVSSGGGKCNNEVVRHEQKTEFASCKDLLTSGDFSVGIEEEPQEVQFSDRQTENGNVTPPSDDSKATSPSAQPLPTDTSHQCELCEVKFSNKAILAVHKQLVHKNCVGEEEVPKSGEKPRKKPLSCNWCLATFNLKSSLLIHVKVTHPAQKDVSEHQRKDSERLNCQICGKTFPKETSLHQHMKAAHGEKPWQCSVCAKNFTTKYFLRKHKRIHTGETPYECGICHKVFTFQQSYHKHMLYHTDDKPYCCSHCGRLFKELSTLNNHERIHSGEKPFACETCGKSFRQRVSYLVHRRIHTGAMPYKCTACNRSFRYKISQRTHKCPEQPPGVVVKTEVSLIDRLQAVINKEEEKLQERAQRTTDMLRTDDHCKGQTVNGSLEGEFTMEKNDFTDNLTTESSIPAIESDSNRTVYDSMELTNNASSPHNLNLNEILFESDSCSQLIKNPDIFSPPTNLDSSPTECLGRLHISSSDYYNQTLLSEQKPPSLSNTPAHPSLTFDSLEDVDLCNLLFDIS